MKRSWLLLSLAVVGLGAPPAASASSSVVVPRGQPVEIAFANDLTGFASGFGASFTNAVQMAVESHPSVRGFPVQVIVVDAPCGDPGADAAAATRIVSNDRNVGVLGQVCSLGFDQALPIYEAAGVAVISGSATADSLPAFAPTVFNRTAVADGDAFDSWYSIVRTLARDLTWQDAYRARFGTEPAAFADLYYDAASLLIRHVQNTSALEGGNLVLDRSALAHAVRGTTKYQGVSCAITLDPATGNRLNDPVALSNCGQ